MRNLSKKKMKNLLQLKLNKFIIKIKKVNSKFRFKGYLIYDIYSKNGISESNLISKIKLYQKIPIPYT
jgi:hypothetical protein